MVAHKYTTTLNKINWVILNTGQFWKRHYYFSFINNCTPVLHTQVVLIGSVFITAFLVSVDEVNTAYCYKWQDSQNVAESTYL